MASPYRKVHCRIWSDDKFPDLSDDAQLVWLHAYTCEYSTGLGIYKASLEALAADKGWSVERYREGFADVSKAGLVRYDERRHVVYFPRYFRWNPPENPNVLSGLLKGLGAIPECSEKSRFINDLRMYAEDWGENYTKVFETFAGTLPERSPKQEQEQEQEVEPSLRSGSAPSDKSLDADASPVLASRSDSPAVETIPLNNGSEYPVTEAQVSEYARLYPAVDVPQALRAMRGWCLANPKRRKTKRGVAAFITSWLSREQDKGGSNHATNPRNNPQRPQSAAERFWARREGEIASHG